MFSEQQQTHQLPTPDKVVVVDVECQGLSARLDTTKAVFLVGVRTKAEGYVGFRRLDLALNVIESYVEKGYWLVYHNSKFDHVLLRNRGLRVGWDKVIDTQVLAYLLNPALESLSLDALTGQKQNLWETLHKEFGLEVKDKKAWWEQDHSQDLATMDVLETYNFNDCKATASLFFSLSSKLPQSSIDAYFKLEQPMLEVLEMMECSGFAFDHLSASIAKTKLEIELIDLQQELESRYGLLPKLSAVGDKYKVKVTEYKENGYKSSAHVPPYYTDNNGKFVTGWDGHVVDSNSGKVVYSHCKLVPFNPSPATGHVYWLIKRTCPEVLETARLTKGGKKQINKDFIADIGEHLPPELPLARIAKLTKRIQMFDTLIEATEADGRIRCDFQHTRTMTGRLATSSPNLQNIPRPDDDEAAEFRKLFVAKPGNVLLVADLDQIELRGLAYYLMVVMGDYSMKEEFDKPDADPHTANANRWKVIRKVAKTLIFLLIYGGQPALMVQRKLFATIEEAVAAFNSVHENQPVIKAFMEKVVAKVRKTKVVRTIGGRSIRYDNISSDDWGKKAKAERQCVNAVIQGSSRDVLHRLAIESLPHIKAHHAFIVNVVHDEMIVECPAECAEVLKAKLNTIWQNRWDLFPGIRVNGDWNIGHTWYEAK